MSIPRILSLNCIISCEGIAKRLNNPTETETVAVPPVSFYRDEICCLLEGEPQYFRFGMVIYGEDGPMKFSVVEEHVSSPLMGESIAMREALAKCKEFAMSDVKQILNSLLPASGRNNQFQRFMDLYRIL